MRIFSKLRRNSSRRRHNNNNDTNNESSKTQNDDDDTNHNYFLSLDNTNTTTKQPKSYYSLEAQKALEAESPSNKKQLEEEVPSTMTHEPLLCELIQYARHRNWKKKVLTVVLCLCCILVFYDLIFGHRIRMWLHTFFDWMKDHEMLAVLSFIGIFTISTLIFIPPSLLIFGAGFAFAEASGGNIWVGIFSATVACYVGSCIGAIIAFYRARYMMRDLVYVFAKRYPIVRAADKALKIHGFKVMLLLRLCPIIPFNGLNYICGVTGVQWEEFVCALVGILPGMILMVVIGATAGSLASSQSYGNQDHQLVGVILVAAGLAFGIIALVVIWHLARIELEKEMKAANAASILNESLRNNHNEEEEQENASVQANASDEQTTPNSDEDENQEGVEIVQDEEWFWIWA